MAALKSRGKRKSNEFGNFRDIEQTLRWEPVDWQHHQFSRRGIIFLHYEIDNDESYEFSHDLIYLTKIEPPMEAGKIKPIWIILDSPGGDASAGFAIYDMIMAAVNAGIEVNIVGKGAVASMAAAIIQAGSRRFVLPHTQFLVHEVSQTVIELAEKVSEGRERIEENERINRIYMSIIAERAGMDVNELIKLSKKTDCWFDAKSALKLGSHGLADEIITSLPF